MTVVDGHAFLGRSRSLDQDLDDLISYMDRLGIDGAVIVAPPPGPFYEEANSIVQEAAGRCPRRLAALYRVNPHLSGEAERVESALRDQGFLGVQIDPTNDGYGVGSPIVEPLIRVAEESGAPVYVRSGDSIFCPPEAVADLAAKFEAVNFVMPTSRRAPR
ncbi:MAG: amidohydrolase family protein, partial [Candidatus Bathyarchaeia archaeon]